MARKRDYAAEYARRQERARELGFASFYERRVAGVRKGTPEYARARGHRGRADLVASLRPGDVVQVARVERSKDGTYRVVDVSVTSMDGSEREYRLRGGALDDEAMDDLLDAIAEADATESYLYGIANLYRAAA